MQQDIWGFSFSQKKRTDIFDHFKTFYFRVETLKNTYDSTLKSLLYIQLKLQKVKKSEKFDDFSKSMIFTDFGRFEIVLG